MADRLFAIGLGSNVGDRLGYLCRAMALIDRVPHLAVLAASHIHESAGWGREDLDPFLNAVLVARSDRLTAHEVLRQLRRIEDRLGRQRTIKWGPRTLDLDLLAADDEVQGGDELTLPHPWIKDRPFVYLPLREVEGFHPRWAVHALASQAGLQIEKDTNRSDLGLPAWSAAVVAPATAVAFPSPHVEAGELPSIQTVETASEEETHALALAIARFLLPGDTVALDAPMGSGKSVFARGLAHGLGITGPIQSPTYLLCRAYETPTLTFEHWDFYRLASEDDLESTGYFSPQGPLLRVIEWAAKFPAEVTAPTLSITIEPTGENGRRITFRPTNGHVPYAIRAACASLAKAGNPS